MSGLLSLIDGMRFTQEPPGVLMDSLSEIVSDSKDVPIVAEGSEPIRYLGVSTLIALAAPIVTMIASAAALSGVWLTQRSTRQTKEMELEHARKLKLIELRELSARMIRNEEQAVLPLYSRLRNQIREVLGFMALDPELVPTAVELDELRKELEDL